MYEPLPTVWVVADEIAAGVSGSISFTPEERMLNVSVPAEKSVWESNADGTNFVV